MHTTIKPYGRPLTDGWEWDGKILKPYGQGPIEGWEWDGKILKPYGRPLNEGWEWDGKILKPYGQGPIKGWEWDGRILKPYGRSPIEGCEWDGKILKPYGQEPIKGWEVEGNAPIYVLALACNLIAAYSSTVDANIERSKSIKRRSKSKKHSPAYEIGERFSDYTLNLIEKLITRIFIHFKK